MRMTALRFDHAAHKTDISFVADCDGGLDQRGYAPTHRRLMRSAIEKVF
jgi:hypothetical protein